LHGFAKDVEGVHLDIVIMTSHVAQFFLDDGDWQSTTAHLFDLLPQVVARQRVEAGPLQGKS
jgi:hypothetical protein